MLTSSCQRSTLNAQRSTLSDQRSTLHSQLSTAKCQVSSVQRQASSVKLQHRRPTKRLGGTKEQGHKYHKTRTLTDGYTWPNPECLEVGATIAVRMLVLLVRVLCKENARHGQRCKIHTPSRPAPSPNEAPGLPVLSPQKPAEIRHATARCSKIVIGAPNASFI